MITWQDYESAPDKTQWIRDTLASYTGGPEHQKVKTEKAYMMGRNTAITQTITNLIVKAERLTDRH